MGSVPGNLCSSVKNGQALGADPVVLSWDSFLITQFKMRETLIFCIKNILSGLVYKAFGSYPSK